MAYDDTSAYPSQPEPPGRARAREGLARAYLVAHLVLAALLIFYSVLLGFGALVPLLKGEGIDPVNLVLLATWSVAGVICAKKTWGGAWSVLVKSLRAAPGEH